MKTRNNRSAAAAAANFNGVFFFFNFFFFTFKSSKTKSKSSDARTAHVIMTRVRSIVVVVRRPEFVNYTNYVLNDAHASALKKSAGKTWRLAGEFFSAFSCFSFLYCSFFHSFFFDTFTPACAVCRIVNFKSSNPARILRSKTSRCCCCFFFSFFYFIFLHFSSVPFCFSVTIYP